MKYKTIHGWISYSTVHCGEFTDIVSYRVLSLTTKPLITIRPTGTANAG